MMSNLSLGTFLSQLYVNLLFFLLLFWICDNFLQLKLIESRFIFWMEQLGIPDCNGYRALCWKILLGYLGCKTPDWPNILQKKRQLYKQFISE